MCVNNLVITFNYSGKLAIEKDFIISLPFYNIGQNHLCLA